MQIDDLKSAQGKIIILFSLLIDYWYDTAKCIWTLCITLYDTPLLNKTNSFSSLFHVWVYRVIVYISFIESINRYYDLHNLKTNLLS